jgi:hypothetical protein
MNGILRDVINLSIKKLDVGYFRLTMLLDCGHTKIRNTRRLIKGGHEIKFPSQATCRECRLFQLKVEGRR